MSAQSASSSSSRSAEEASAALEKKGYVTVCDVAGFSGVLSRIWSSPPPAAKRIDDNERILDAVRRLL